MEELKKAFYEVMYKYEKSFGETGVMTNLNLWAQEKAGLLELLRRHPNWDEDAKAIVFSFDEGRGIQRDVVDEIAFTMEDLAAEQINRGVDDHGRHVTNEASSASPARWLFSGWNCTANRLSRATAATSCRSPNSARPWITASSSGTAWYECTK